MKKRVFSGIRPTGKLHIGNYLGAVKNYVAMQNEYECVYSIVDLHALTTLNNTAKLQENTYEAFLDLLAAGLDPQKSVVFVQSHVPEINELFTILSMATPLSWLLRVPTFKEKARLHAQNVNYGLVGYPVLMTADIVLYKAEHVPVGEDQLPHLELAREIVRRFNEIFGDTFPEPQAKLTNYPLVVGLDGKDKMSKSLDNHIEIAATDEETTKRVMSAMTDPSRKLRSDPGHPEVCNVSKLRKHFEPSLATQFESECREAKIGCVSCKQALANAINNDLAPFRKRRKELSANPEYVHKAMENGAYRAQIIARETIDEVKRKVGLK